MDRSWVEINLDIIAHNLKIYRESISSSYDIMAVVKANAYGHGDVRIAKILAENGVNNFAVSNLDEAYRLRQAGINGQILILGYTPPDEISKVIENDITQALLSEEYAAILTKQGKKLKCQFAIDTGMNRIGLDAEQLKRCEQVIRDYYAKFDMTGIFTHLCMADSSNIHAKQFTKEQISKFEAIVNSVADLNMPYNHCMNSAGALWHASSASGLVRLGIMLYGLKPDYDNVLPEGIKPVLSWKSVVSMIKWVEPEEYVGYGGTFLVETKMRIATIPTGYADGYNRNLSNMGYVLIAGKKAPIVGRICMDQMMVDVTGIDNVNIGTEVVLLGESGQEFFSADDMAHLLDTIGYEILCNISSRVERRYI